MKARKRFGQHFLEPAWVLKVIDAVAPGPEDVFLEIGPGRGALTRALAERAGRIIAVEVDRDLASALGSAVGLPNVTVVTGDVLRLDLSAVLPRASEVERLRVAGNLPYNISSPILFRLLELQSTTGRLRDATLMLQREVVDRMVAPPGSGDYGPLAVLLGWRARVTRLLTLPPGAFRPPPLVTSAVVRLDFLDPAAVPAAPPLFESMVRTLFTQRRKTVANALRPVAEPLGLEPVPVLHAAGIDPSLRPERLDAGSLRALAFALDSARR